MTNTTQPSEDVKASLARYMKGEQMAYEVREQPYGSGKYVIINTGKTVWLKGGNSSFNRFRSLKAAERYKKKMERQS